MNLVRKKEKIVDENKSPDGPDDTSKAGCESNLLMADYLCYSFINNFCVNWRTEWQKKYSETLNHIDEIFKLNKLVIYWF